MISALEPVQNTVDEYFQKKQKLRERKAEYQQEKQEIAEKGRKLDEIADFCIVETVAEIKINLDDLLELVKNHPNNENSKTIFDNQIWNHAIFSLFRTKKQEALKGKNKVRQQLPWSKEKKGRPRINPILVFTYNDGTKIEVNSRLPNRLRLAKAIKNNLSGKISIDSRENYFYISHVDTETVRIYNPLLDNNTGLKEVTIC